MKRINKRTLFVVLAAVATMTSCKKYLDVNTDPNRVTDLNVTPELIFTQAENAVGTRQASGDWLFLDQWIGYFAQNGDFAPQANIIDYNIDFSFTNNLWGNHYNTLYDLYLVHQKGLISGDTLAAGASMVLSAKLFQELVDLFGDLPYSQAFQTATYTRPAYDKAQAIYAALQASLDSAIIYLNTNAGLTESKNFTSSDIIANGDASKWILYANTIKLRLLIRQSEVSGFDPTAEIAKINANGGVMMAGQSMSDNPGYSNDVNKQSPFYANYGWSPSSVPATTADNANYYIVTTFESSNDPEGDPRLSRFFYPVGFTGSNFVGDQFGALQKNIPGASSSSYFGPALVGTVNSSHVGDGSGAKQNQWIIPSYESMFWYAEAVARGWISGDAATAYHSAMLEAFTWLGVTNPDSTLTAYIANNPDIADYNTVKSSSAETQAKFIAYQKYLSLVGIDPYEAFTDQNRLHFLPDNGYISLDAGRISSVLPVRLPYPQTEYTSNATNVGAEGTINIFSSKLFWEP